MKYFSTKNWLIMAMMTALSIILSRFFSIQTDILRFSLGYVPIILTGVLLGPIPGAAVGLISDFLGALFFSSSGWFPPQALAPLFIGLWSGFLRKFILKNNFWLTVLIVFIGSVISRMLISSICLGYLMGKGFLATLAIRIPFGIIMTAIDSTVIYLLMKSPVVKFILLDKSKPNNVLEEHRPNELQ